MNQSPVLNRRKPEDWPKVYFFHIPKTGGSSLGSWMRRLYPPGTVIPVAEMEEVILLSRAQLSGYKCYVGHFSNALEGVVSPPLHTITILRNPAEHVISLLKHVERLPAEIMVRYKDGYLKVIQEIKKKKGNLEACLDSAECRKFLYNQQTRFLTAPLDLNRYLDGPFNSWHLHLCETFDSMPDQNTLAENARKKLDSMTAVGIHERFEDSANLLMFRAGLPVPLKWPRKNVSPEREKKPEYSHLESAGLSSGVRKDLESLLQADFMAYEHAVSLFEKDFVSTPGFPQNLERWKKVPLTNREYFVKKSKHWKIIFGKLLGKG